MYMRRSSVGWNGTKGMSRTFRQQCYFGKHILAIAVIDVAICSTHINLIWLLPLLKYPTIFCGSIHTTHRTTPHHTASYALFGSLCRSLYRLFVGIYSADWAILCLFLNTYFQHTVHFSCTSVYSLVRFLSRNEDDKFRQAAVGIMKIFSFFSTLYSLKSHQTAAFLFQQKSMV